MITYLASRVDITPTQTDTWEDRDVSANVPSGAKAVLIHLIRDTGTSYDIGWRMNGSTDADISVLTSQPNHFDIIVGVDSNRILELYTSSLTSFTVYLMGYANETDVNMFTNRTANKVPGTGSFLDIDISGDTTGADVAIAAIFELSGTSFRNWGLRKNGSTDSRLAFTGLHVSFIIGVDANEICEINVAGANFFAYLTGYVKSKAVMNTNATDRSMTNVGVFENISTAAGAVGDIIEVFANVNLKYALRKDGTSLNDYFKTSQHNFRLIEVVSDIIEGQIENTNIDFFEIGYTETPSAGGSTINLLSVINTTSSVISPLLINRPLSDSIAILSSIASTLTITANSIDLLSSISTLSSIVSTLSIDRNLSGSSSSTSDIVAILTIIRDLTNTINTISQIDAALLTDRNLSSTIPITSSILFGKPLIDRNLASTVNSLSSITLSTIEVLRNLLSQIDNVSSIISTVDVDRNLSGTANTISDIVSALLVDRNLSGSISSLSDIIASLNTAAIIALLSNIGSTSSIVSTIDVLRDISTNISSISDILSSLIVDRNLSGTVNTISDIQSTIDTARNLSGQINSLSNILSTVYILRNLNSTINSVSDIASTLNISIGLSGQIDTISLITALLSVTGVVDLFSNISSVSDIVVNTINVDRNLIGDSNSLSDILSTLNIDRNITGTVNTSSDITSTVNINRDLSGNISIASDITVQELIRILNLSATVSTVSSIPSTLFVDRKFIGTVNLSSDLLAGLIISRLFSGSISSVSSITANLISSIPVAFRELLNLVSGVTLNVTSSSTATKIDTKESTGTLIKTLDSEVEDS